MGTSLRWGADSLNQSPVIFGNAMPKSGSHLLTQVLSGFTFLGPFVDPGFPPVNRFEDNRNLSKEDVLANIERLRPGDIAYGYLHAKDPYLTVLTRPEMVSIFAYRDPRDVIVSHVFFATELYTNHGMNRYYNEMLNTMEERIDAAICGVEEPGYELSSIAVKYKAYLGWLDVPEVLCVSYEDLILRRQQAINAILDYISERGFEPNVERSRAIEILAGGIAPRRSGTFRKGKPGNWREHFSAHNIAVFKEYTGDLLIRLGYEKDQDW
jgi:hypothetical protein